ncbi:argininosuccinate synthase [Collinsella sp. AGMB00827]|uniref:Argininosuccinate synthase n=1 Tax=Collinsella ureilytica TaxID=2869515 RepID=A0ABS7MMS1_9ACTN|nr:argininosuccinate synthase [Collinsella urealyticum]MBY4798370.1 argininosuccinate synthase [Collinsella urealyticum]
MSKQQSKEKVVLAYSGGLDTSVCVKWLQEEKNLDVIAVLGDVGQEHDGLEAIKEKAFSLGVIACEVVDMRDEFCANYVVPALAANALYENKYPLVSALSRPLIAQHLVHAAHVHGASYVAHGCTGKGNDQVRFELSIMTLDPHLSVIAPVREWDLGMRPDEIAYAVAHGVPVEASIEKPYSIDDNLWGRAIEAGALEDPWAAPPSDIWTMTTAAEDAPDAATSVVIGFEHGVPVSLNGHAMELAELIVNLNTLAGSNGFGRIDMIENRCVGLKSRECYEAPGALALIQAHKALEDLCLEASVLHAKLELEQTWAGLVYAGQWFSPLKQALDAFMHETQQHVTGEVRLKFYKGSCTVSGRRSSSSLYDQKLATYDNDEAFDQTDAMGFINISSLPLKTWAAAQGSQANTPSLSVSKKHASGSGVNSVCAVAPELVSDEEPALLKAAC